MTGDAFTEHRSLLFTVAYEMLGSAADAEDVVQETWLRWEAVDHTEVQDHRAYLVRIVTRQALNRLRTLTRRREDYVGEWLPEPVSTTSDVAEDVALVESISMAMLTVLETLGPVERTVFVLREVFDIPHDEIAEALDKSPAAVRQIAHRAREHVHARQPRVAVTHAEHAQAVDHLLSAMRGGDVDALLRVLSPDVVLVSDSGGLVPAARQPIVGAERVAGLLAALTERLPEAELVPTVLNGVAGVTVVLDGAPNTAVSFTVEDGLITHLYAVRNPHKLQRLATTTSLTR